MPPCPPSNPNQGQLIPLGTVCYQSGFICYAESFPFIERDYYGADFDSCTVPFSAFPSLPSPVTLSDLLEAIQLAANLCGLYHSGTLDAIYWFSGVGSPICFAGLDGVSGPTNLGLSFVPTGDPPPADPGNPADPSYVFFPQIAGQPNIEREATLWYPALPTGKPDTSQSPTYCDSTTGVELTPAEELTITQCPDTANRPVPVQADVTNVTQAGPDVNIDTSNSVGDPAIHFQYVTIESTGGGVTESNETPCGTLPVYGSTGQAFTFTSYTIQNGDEHIERIYDGPSCLTATLLSVDIKRCDVVNILDTSGTTPLPCPIIFPIIIADPNGGPDISVINQAALDAVLDGYAGGGFTFDPITCQYTRVVNPSAPPVVDILTICDTNCFINVIPPGPSTAVVTNFHSEDILAVNIDATVDHELTISIVKDELGNVVPTTPIFTVNWTGIPGGLPLTLDNVVFSVTYTGQFSSDLSVAIQAQVLQQFSLDHTGAEFQLTSDKDGVAAILNDGDNWTPAIPPAPTPGTYSPYQAGGTPGLRWGIDYNSPGPACPSALVQDEVCDFHSFEQFFGIITPSPDLQGVGERELWNQASYQIGKVVPVADPRHDQFDGSTGVQALTNSWPMFPEGAPPNILDQTTMVSELWHTVNLPGTLYTIDGGSNDLIRSTNHFTTPAPPFSTAAIPTAVFGNKWLPGTGGMAKLYGYMETGNFWAQGNNNVVLKQLCSAIMEMPYEVGNEDFVSLGTGPPQTVASPAGGCCSQLVIRVLPFLFRRGRFIPVTFDDFDVRVVYGGTFGPPAGLTYPLNAAVEGVTGGVTVFSATGISAGIIYGGGPAPGLETLFIPANFTSTNCNDGTPYQIEIIGRITDPLDSTQYELFSISEYLANSTK